MNKAQKIKNYDPSGVAGADTNIFGLPFNEQESETVIIPVPWEVTVSYGGGTLEGPEAIQEASYQVDLYDPNLKDAWQLGIHIDALNKNLKKHSKQLRKKAEVIIAEISGQKVKESKTTLEKYRREIEAGCEQMNAWVKQRCLHFLNKNKRVALIGGDHSTPLGMMQALAEKYKSYGVLQIDAHADLRKAYEGFEYSHASIMYNALNIKQINKLVQVGIRDYCQEEVDFINSNKERVKVFFDRDIKQTLYRGDSWDRICNRIVKELPEHVYLSFDIDGLDPKLCPNTGTPVAGGFETEEVLFLLEKVVKSGRKIIAFDINEVSPAKDNDWDANVAARLLYRICNLMALSNS